MRYLAKSVITFIFLLFIQVALSQAPTINWQNTVGAVGDDVVSSVVANDDGTFLIVSTSDSGVAYEKTVDTHGGYDVWLLKIDAQGNSIWQESLGGNRDDYAKAAVASGDGGYVIFITSDSSISGNKTEATFGGNDLWIVKVDGNGSIVWQNTIGGSIHDYATTAIDQTADSGFIIIGNTISGISGDMTHNSRGQSDLWMIKLDSNGLMQWDKRIGGNHTDQAMAVKQTSDGGYIIGAYSRSDASGEKTENVSGWSDFWVIKTDALGNIVWENTIGGDRGDFLTDLELTSSGNYVIAGYSYSNTSRDKDSDSIGETDYWIMELDQTGNIIWQNTVGGTSNDFAWSISKDGSDYLIAGQSGSQISGDKTEQSRGFDDFWLVKVGSTGNVLWDKTLGGSLSDTLTEVRATSDGFLLAGHSSSGPNGDRTEPSASRDIWLVALNPDQTASTENQNLNQISIAPNPAKDMLYIDAGVPTTAKLYDLQGRLMRETLSDEVQIQDLTTGTYILQVFDSEKNLLKTSRILKE